MHADNREGVVCRLRQVPGLKGDPMIGIGYLPGLDHALVRGYAVWPAPCGMILQAFVGTSDWTPVHYDPDIRFWFAVHPVNCPENPPASGQE